MHSLGSQLFRDEAAKLTDQLLRAYDPSPLFAYRDLEPDGRRVDCAGLIDGAAGVAPRPPRGSIADRAGLGLRLPPELKLSA